ncbi:hypothetical protein [Serratia marcescens]|uniref:hypothetical protein n=1 Tax=Serratia marcescens TaxID=615 RepID=UPI0002B88752|nr:hypothetical protein [Serratia marcescens]EMF05321.1 hypothetical protein F518_12963 [Serratia marcescens VGH107]
MGRLPKKKWPAASLILLLVSALIFHLYIFIRHGYDVGIGILLWSFTPYLLIVILFRTMSELGAILGSMIALFFDVITYYDVFGSSVHSIALIGLMFTPVTNFVLGADWFYYFTFFDGTTYYDISGDSTHSAAPIGIIFTPIANSFLVLIVSICVAVLTMFHSYMQARSKRRAF